MHKSNSKADSNGKVSLNSVHPQVTHQSDHPAAATTTVHSLPIQNGSPIRESSSVSTVACTDTTGSVQKKVSLTESAQNDLFLADIFKQSFEKTFHINARNNRLIHVRQYARTQAPTTEKQLYNKAASIPNNQQQHSSSSVVLFLIHGVGGSMRIWDPQIRYFLQEGYEIITLDLLGHGSSSTPAGYAPYMFRELALDVLFVFDKFCKRRNVLIGHSYGTSFCALLSKERENLVSKMVLISGGGPTALMPDACSAFCLPLPFFYVVQPVLLKMFRRMAFHVNTSDSIKEKITTFGISAHVLKAIMQGQLWEESDEQYHTNLSVPVLLIYGSGDKFVSLADEVWMHETLFGSTLEVIENAGHMVMIEEPAEVNRLIRNFLNRDASTRLCGSIEPLSCQPTNTCSFSSDQSNYSLRDDVTRQDGSSMRCSSRLSCASVSGGKYRKKMF